MRATLTLISPFILPLTLPLTLLVTLGSSQAVAQWEVRPAPASWGLPQNGVAAQSQTTSPTQMPASAQTQAHSQTPGAQTPSFNEAVTCSAALQLATMAAPSWGREQGVTNITNAWLQKVFALGEPQGITGDKVPGFVEAEMQRQLEGAASDPALLSSRAFECAARLP